MQYNAGNNSAIMCYQPCIILKKIIILILSGEKMKRNRSIIGNTAWLYTIIMREPMSQSYYGQYSINPFYRTFSEGIAKSPVLCCNRQEKFPLKGRGR